MFSPFAFMTPSIPTIPTSGLVAWYDPSDYTGTTTWVDRSTNGLDLTLSANALSYSSAYLDLKGISGISPITALLNGTTDLTIINVNSFFANNIGLASWSIGEGKVSSRVNELRQDNAPSPNDYAVMSLWAGDGNKGLVASDNISLPYPFQPGNPSARLPYIFPYPVQQRWSVPVTTPSINTLFSYRFGNGFSPGNVEFGMVDNGDTACFNDGGGTCYPVDTMLGTSVLDNINTDFTNPLGSNSNYNLGSSSTIRINGVNSSTGIISGGFIPVAFGATIVYNRRITDLELQEIVDYYKPTYDFR